MVKYNYTDVFFLYIFHDGALELHVYLHDGACMLVTLYDSIIEQWVLQV